MSFQKFWILVSVFGAVNVAPCRSIFAQIQVEISCQRAVELTEAISFSVAELYSKLQDLEETVAKGTDPHLTLEERSTLNQEFHRLYEDIKRYVDETAYIDALNRKIFFFRYPHELKILGAGSTNFPGEIYVFKSDSLDQSSPTYSNLLRTYLLPRALIRHFQFEVLTGDYLIRDFAIPRPDPDQVSQFFQNASALAVSKAINDTVDSHHVRARPLRARILFALKSLEFSHSGTIQLEGSKLYVDPGAKIEDVVRELSLLVADVKTYLIRPPEGLPTLAFEWTDGRNLSLLFSEGFLSIFSRMDPNDRIARMAIYQYINDTGSTWPDRHNYGQWQSIPTGVSQAHEIRFEANVPHSVCAPIGFATSSAANNLGRAFDEEFLLGSGQIGIYFHEDLKNDRLMADHFNLNSISSSRDAVELTRNLRLKAAHFRSQWNIIDRFCE